MAHSPGSAERRAHLIREMSRQGDRNSSGESNASWNDGSVNGQFPNYDTASQQLPAVRPDLDFQINTSALRRAFPDFSQSGSSEEDSIEMSRGLKRNAKNTPSRDMPSADVTEDMPFTFGDGVKYRITGTPPIRPRNQNIQMRPNEEKKSANAKSVPDGKENDDGGKETRYGSASAEENENEGSKDINLHARVESEESVSGPWNASSRNTRFGSRRSKNAAHQHQPYQNATQTSQNSAGNGGQQSFVLPDMPNITELISGVRQDGTPLFTRSAKSRSRFTTPGSNRRLKHTSIPVGNVPVPTDEKALYVSLQLLQEKVSTLEEQKAHAERRLDDYEMEVLQLKSKLEEREHARHSDSGIGTDVDEAKAKDTQGEKSNLELSIKTLQDRLERTNRKVSKSEVTIQNLTKDRDAAHEQLAIAFLNSEDLKNESQAMREELENIRNQVVDLNREHEKRVSQLTMQETELRAKIERREKAIKEMSSLAKELWKTRSALAASSEPSHITPSYQSQAPTHIQHQKTRRQSHGSESEPVKLSGTTKGNSESQARTISKSTATTAGTSRRHRVTRSQNIVYDSEPDAGSDAESTTNIIAPQPFDAQELTKNSTYMSFMEGDEVSKLRRIVEEDKAKLAASGGNTGDKSGRTVLPRKSSLKKVQYTDDASREQSGYSGIIRDDTTIEDNTKTTRSMGGDRQPTQQSVASVSSERRRRSGTTEQAEMTSAFILPDITLTDAALHARLRSGNAQYGVKQTISIPRPIPVSDRMPVATESEPDVTIRPAQPPAVALAMVLKSLEDELAQLRAQLAHQESLYHKHDPALSKQKRKIVYARMQKLLAAIETRADQIYALYDVLEGQKAHGEEMKEEEIEVTLQNIGIDPDVLRTAAQSSRRASARTDNFEHAGDQAGDVDASEDGDYSEELPWEGFEPTQTQTLDNVGRWTARGAV